MLLLLLLLLPKTRYKCIIISHVGCLFFLEGPPGACIPTSDAACDCQLPSYDAKKCKIAFLQKKAKHEGILAASATSVIILMLIIVFAHEGRLNTYSALVEQWNKGLVLFVLCVLF